MATPKEFDTIRPFEPEEIPAVADRLAKDEIFKGVVAKLYPKIPFEGIINKVKTCSSSLDFQKKFVYDIVKGIIDERTAGCDMDYSEIDNKLNFTFISNHRDIVLDSAMLDKLMIDDSFITTCEIAIGDNLLSLPWIKDVVRLNKAFIVERSLGMREMLLSSKRLSEYMHFAIKEKKENIWIAQREGRAKDSNDQTQESILKMMAMGGEGSAAERLIALHLVPLTISYEYDPCDYLKAREFQLKRDNSSWKKAPGDDLKSMTTGILGFKGKVHYHCSSCIDDYIKSHSDLPKGEIFVNIANKIDQDIFKNYKLYPGNYAALDVLSGKEDFASHYTLEEKSAFLKYIDGQLEKITDIPNKDDAFLRERILTMYANPVRNHIKVSR